MIDRSSTLRNRDRLYFRLPIAKESPAMNAVTLSSKYQVVIPQAVRAQLCLKPGQQFQVVALQGRVELIPVEPAKALRGFMKGARAEVGREKRERGL